MAKMPMNSDPSQMESDVYKDKADADRDPGHSPQLDDSRPEVKAASQAMQSDSNVSEVAETQDSHAVDTHGPDKRDATCGAGCRPTS